MDDLEKMPTRKKKFSERQKDYNLSQKSIVHIIGTNISLFVCMLLPFFLIGFIWTDFGTPKISLKLISDGIVSVALFIVGEIMMMQIGANGGKLDDDYKKARVDLDGVLESVHNLGTLLLPVFCEWQIDAEMEQATTARLRYLRMSKEDLQKTKGMSKKDLIRKYGARKAKRIIALHKLEPMELNEAVLLYNNGNALSRGGVPESGEEFIDRKKHSPQLIMTAVFTGLLTVSVAITLTNDLSFSRVMYTAFKLIMLLYRMSDGYSIGAKAYNTVEVRQLSARAKYLRQYTQFVNEKIYLKIDKKYGDTSAFEDSPVEAATEAHAEQPVETAEEPAQTEIPLEA